jgi:phage terminase large subunit GpA-like protein
VTAPAPAKTYSVVERIREPQREALRDAVKRALARAYMPPPKIPLSEWADAYRMLSPEAAAQPGRWKTAKEPMAKGPMDAASDPMVEKFTVMCAAQIMKTELLLNVAGYYIHGDPAPILMVQPTVEMAEAFSKDRVAPMIRDTPVLKAVFSGKAKDSSDTILQKAFPGGRLTMTGANAPASLASRPIRVVLCDEVDRFPASAGQEGDPVGLAEKRTTTFWNRKIGLVSTPTIKGVSRIEASYLEGDQRKFLVPCPHCGVRQELVWAGVKWENGDPDTAHYVCQAADEDTGEITCGEAWTESDRLDAISKAGQMENGGWVATKPFKGHASFHASQLASKRVPLHRVVKEFLDAKPFPERLKQWVNTVLAETWEEGGEKVDPDSLYARREDYDAGLELPPGRGPDHGRHRYSRQPLGMRDRGLGRARGALVARLHRVHGRPFNAVLLGSPGRAPAAHIPAPDRRHIQDRGGVRRLRRPPYSGRLRILQRPHGPPHLCDQGNRRP